MSNFTRSCLFLATITTAAFGASDSCGSFKVEDHKLKQSQDKCLGAKNLDIFSEDYKRKIQDKVKSNPNCKHIVAIGAKETVPEFQFFVDHFGNATNTNDTNRFALLREIPEQKYQDACAAVAEIQSCLVETIYPWMKLAIGLLEQESCCTEFMDNISIKEYSIVDRFEMMVNQVSNLFCLNRIPDKIVTEEQNCAYTIVQSMLPPDTDEAVANLKKLVQIPNDQACKAFNGQEYIDTNGKSGNLTSNLPIGSCSSAFDTIFSTAKAFLIDDGENSLYEFAIEWDSSLRRYRDELEKQVGPLRRLFGDDSCAKIDSSNIEGMNGSICLNFPTEFTEECYPSLAEKGVVGGPMKGLVGDPVESSSDSDSGNSTTPIMITLALGALAMMLMNNRWM